MTRPSVARKPRTAALALMGLTGTLTTEDYRAAQRAKGGPLFSARTQRRLAEYGKMLAEERYFDWTQRIGDTW